MSCLEAAEVLGISERHFWRLRDRYEAAGAEDVCCAVVAPVAEAARPACRGLFAGALSDGAGRSMPAAYAGVPPCTRGPKPTLGEANDPRE